VVEVLAGSTKGNTWKPQLDIKEGLLTYTLFIDRVDKRTGESVAIKIIDVENAEDEVDDIIQEIAILSELKSPYVTKYHGSYLKGSHLWIVMEYCSGGSCHGLLVPGPIHEEYIAIIMRELLKGLDYLHSDQKLHRDIKGNQHLTFLPEKERN
jgi:serine/threonine protein kinase